MRALTLLGVVMALATSASQYILRAEQTERYAHPQASRHYTNSTVVRSTWSTKPRTGSTSTADRQTTDRKTTNGRITGTHTTDTLGTSLQITSRQPTSRQPTSRQPASRQPTSRQPTSIHTTKGTVTISSHASVSISTRETWSPRPGESTTVGTLSPTYPSSISTSHHSYTITLRSSRSGYSKTPVSKTTRQQTSRYERSTAYLTSLATTPVSESTMQKPSGYQPSTSDFTTPATTDTTRTTSHLGFRTTVTPPHSIVTPVLTTKDDASKTPISSGVTTPSSSISDVPSTNPHSESDHSTFRTATTSTERKVSKQPSATAPPVSSAEGSGPRPVSESAALSATTTDTTYPSDTVTTRTRPAKDSGMTTTNLADETVTINSSSSQTSGGGSGQPYTNSASLAPLHVTPTTMTPSTFYYGLPVVKPLKPESLTTATTSTDYLWSGSYVYDGSTSVIGQRPAHSSSDASTRSMTSTMQLNAPHSSSDSFASRHTIGTTNSSSRHGSDASATSSHMPITTSEDGGSDTQPTNSLPSPGTNASTKTRLGTHCTTALCGSHPDNDAFASNSSNLSPKQRAKTAGIAIGAAGLSMAFGAAMFAGARRYNRRKQRHQRSYLSSDSQTALAAKSNSYNQVRMVGALYGRGQPRSNEPSYGAVGVGSANGHRGTRRNANIFFPQAP